MRIRLFCGCCRSKNNRGLSRGLLLRGWTCLLPCGIPSPRLCRKHLPLCCCGLCCCVSEFIPETWGVDVCHFLLIFRRCPGYSLLQGEFVVIPDLQLVLGRVATDQQLSIVEINRISSHMQPKNSVDWFTLPDVPQMKDGIPSSWYYCVVVNEFYWKNPVGMSSVVPFCASQIRTYTFCVYFALFLL